MPRTCLKIISPSPCGRGPGGGGSIFAVFPEATFHPHPNPPPSRGREFNFEIGSNKKKLTAKNAKFFISKK
jgi:hypothetical protein